ncbi:MAG TPA: aspartate 1-decarboxylase [Thermoanaerobaculia bacterium]|nr:aspartate 1-decarboxylase [Thermoanaerobaculia bacterium]
MIRFFLRSRIDGATVTGTNLDAEDSITIDSHLMHAAGLLPYEKVEVCDLTSGERFETSVVEGEAGSGTIGINGAASHLAREGDTIVVACWALLHEGQIASHRPRFVRAGKGNRAREIREVETASPVVDS